MELNEITGQIVDSAMKVHSALGPGLLEPAYQGCLLFELHRRGLKALKEVATPIFYDGVKIDVGFRIDLLVEDAVIVELKAVEKIHPIHKAQLITYLKLTDTRVGLLINFNVQRLKDGISRIAN